MNIEKVIQEDRQAKLTVEYTSGEFEGFKRRAAKKISNNAKIPGFRPGKAPYQVIVNHYGEGAIIQEAIDLLIDDDYAKILDEAEIEPSAAGTLETLENLDPPKFILMVPLKPEIDLGDYREIRKDFELEEFNTNAVDDRIMSIRRNSATIVPANHPAEVGDLVYFTLSGEFLNPEDEEDATITDKTPQQVIIPDEDEISEHEWPYPGFSRALLGVNDGDVKELQFSYPDDFEDEEFQGKTAIFTVDVQSVKALELPEFDEDFVKSLGDFESPEDFQEKLEQEMREEHENEYEQDYLDTVLNEIIENATLNYPPQMLDHEQEHILEDLKERLERQKMDFDAYLNLRDKDEETLIQEEIRPVAKRRLERTLVVEALIKAEDLKLKEDSIGKQVSDVVNEIFRTGRGAELHKEMGEADFSRMVMMESANRAMNNLLEERLKLIATGQPIPEDDESEETETVSEDESDLVNETDDVLSEADAPEVIESEEDTDQVTEQDQDETSANESALVVEEPQADMDVEDSQQEEAPATESADKAVDEKE